MQTQIFLTAILALALHAGVLSQNNKNILMTRVSTGSTKQVKATKADNKDVQQLNSRIADFDKQIAELQKQKENLNQDINGFFETKELNSNSIELTKVENEAARSFQTYEKNYVIINDLLAMATSSQVTAQIVEMLIQSAAWANSAKLMKQEAFAENTPEARAGALSNCLEKINAAIGKQEVVINTLEKMPAGGSAICYGTK